ncbi:MAG: DUF86 domain-containing protein [Bacteroidales bacterium]|nr:DUF86 domain-containing protein [Bacteroidales bacterium]
MQGKLGDKARMLHILNAIQEIESYNRDINFDTFKKASIIKFATIKQLEIIGEASNHISQETKSKYNNIQWERIIGLRNILIHEYFGVDAKIVWDVICVDIPEFKAQIRAALDELEV